MSTRFFVLKVGQPAFHRLTKRAIDMGRPFREDILCLHAASAHYLKNHWKLQYLLHSVAMPWEMF